MLSLFSGSRPKSSSKYSEDRALEGSEPPADDTSVLDEQEGSVITSLISQLRIGMDLSKVTFPTFVLEPRSMLERITDFMSHPDLIFGAEKEPSAEERFIRVLQYYLSGWHIKPKGVKKPYNPILGEFFRCRYEYPDGSEGFYISEQVSHHPPVSAYFYISPANKVRITGELKPKSKFLGNSVATIMEGENRVFLMGKPEDGEYIVTMPSMYARGILFGKMVIELGDSCTAKNERTGMHCDIEFKTKGFFTGSYNHLVGKVKKDGSDIGEITGQWTQCMEYKDCKTLKKRVLFDVHSSQNNKIVPKVVAEESAQESNESRRLWTGLTDAIAAKNMERAQEAKSAVEDAQRDLRKQLEERGETHTPRFFTQQPGGRWLPNIQLPDDPKEMVTAVRRWMWSESP